MELGKQDTAIVLKEDGTIEMHLPKCFEEENSVPENVVKFILMVMHFDKGSPDLMKVLDAYLAEATSTSE